MVLGFMDGDRLFAVQDDGLKVEHHALEQSKTYMISLGKKFKDIDLISRYIYSKNQMNYPKIETMLDQNLYQ